jgi:hypothetical protein
MFRWWLEKIKEDLHRRLKHAAIDSNMTLHSFILKALENHVDNNGSKIEKKLSTEDQPATSHR